MNMNKSWAKRILELILKFALIGIAAYFILSKLQNTEYHGAFTYTWHNTEIYLTAFFALWATNLLFDATIWQVVNNFVENISLKRAFKTNFICYALAFITPANSGELAGRYVMLNQKGDRQKTVFLTFWSHFPRFITKFLLGGSALVLIAFFKQKLSATQALLAVALISLALITVYLSILKIQKWIHSRTTAKWNISKYILNNRPVLSEKFTLLALSIGKYLSYNLQFIGLLAMWNPSIVGPELFLSVIVFYFITALIPTFAAADFIIKGALAILIFDTQLVSEAELINASFIIWIFNIALPALFGTGIILKTNLLHSIKMRFSRGNHYDL